MTDFTTDYRMLIGGECVSAQRSMPVVNPATAAVFAHAPDASAEDLDRAVKAALAAQPGWRARPLAQRRADLIAAAALVEAHADPLAELFTREQGRPTGFAREEVIGAAAWMRGTAALEIPVEIIEDTPQRRIEVHHEPLGVVCGIVPWNFPVAQAIWKIGAPLLAGNTVVLKPSPYTPLCTLKIGELLRNIFPPGVINVISGGHALGPLMTAHPGFRKISFTGSTATGKRIMQTASLDLKRVTLELGGNDPAIVLPDADLDAVAPQLFFGAFFNTAQICAAIKRLYVHEDIYDALRDQIHAIALSAAVGDGSVPGTMFGPIQNERQYRRVLGLLEDAKASGLTLLQGGKIPDGPGYFIPITIVDNPPDTSRVVVEEAFGPVLPMLRFRDIDDVIRRANDSAYGLTASVWSADVGQAQAIARRLESGTVWINQILTLTPATPVAGAKQSGVGVESGLAGLLEFTQTKTIFVPKNAAACA